MSYHTFDQKGYYFANIDETLIQNEMNTKNVEVEISMYTGCLDSSPYPQYLRNEIKSVIENIVPIVSIEQFIQQTGQKCVYENLYQTTWDNYTIYLCEKEHHVLDYIIFDNNFIINKSPYYAPIEHPVNTQCPWVGEYTEEKATIDVFMLPNQGACPQHARCLFVIGIFFSFEPPPSNILWEQLCCDPFFSKVIWFDIATQNWRDQIFQNTIYQNAVNGPCKYINGTEICSGPGFVDSGGRIVLQSLAVPAFISAQQEYSGCSSDRNSTCIHWIGVDSVVQGGGGGVGSDLLETCPPQKWVPQDIVETAFVIPNVRPECFGCQIKRGSVYFQDNLPVSSEKCEWWDIICHSSELGATYGQALSTWLKVNKRFLIHSISTSCTSLWAGAIKNKLGICDKNITNLDKNNNPEWTDIQKISSRMQIAALCGTSSNLNSHDYTGVLYSTLHSELGLDQKTDGIIPYLSCTNAYKYSPSVTEKNFIPDFKSRYFSSRTHHGQISSCLHDTNVFMVELTRPVDTRICSWLRNVIVYEESP
jgi:hypothetical protein